jgi:hypothetical protein
MSRPAVGVHSVLGALHRVDLGSVADVSEARSASITHFYAGDAGRMDPSKVSISRVHGGLPFDSFPTPESHASAPLPSTSCLSSDLLLKL